MIVLGLSLIGLVLMVFACRLLDQDRLWLGGAVMAAGFLLIVIGTMFTPSGELKRPLVLDA